MTEPTYLRTTRAAYDAVAVLYSDLFRNALDSRPLNRALIAAFAELVLATDVGPVADIGCGPGQVTAHLRSLGLTAFGIDLSPTMIALARQEYPGLRFDEGSMTDLDLPDQALGGILAWHSVIHTPPEQLPTVLTEFHRVLAPGGYLLLAFQAGGEPPAQPFDHKVSVAYRWSLDHLAELLRRTGMVEVARLVREPVERERFEAGHLLAQRPSR